MHNIIILYTPWFGGVSEYSGLFALWDVTATLALNTRVHFVPDMPSHHIASTNAAEAATQMEAIASQSFYYTYKFSSRIDKNK